MNHYLHRLSRTATIAGAFLLCAAIPSLASAQSYPPPPPGPAAGPATAPMGQVGARVVPERKGLTLGIGLGAGGMESDDGPIECFDCDDSVAGSADFHVGLMLNPRLAIMYEAWGTGQALNAAADVTLVQVLSMAAAQYWLTPRLWVKAGIGTAHLSESMSGDNDSKEIDTGVAGMAAVGIELIQGPRWALDVQLRGGSGTYEGIDDKVFQGTLQVGLNWY